MYKYKYNHDTECLTFKVVTNSGGYYENFEKEYIIANITPDEARELFLSDIEDNRRSWLYKYSEDYLCEIEFNIKNNDVLEEDDDW